MMRLSPLASSRCLLLGSKLSPVSPPRKLPTAARTAAATAARAAAARAAAAAAAAAARGPSCMQRRTYIHFSRTVPEDYELPIDTMPTDIDSLMKAKPKELNFFENYWYWRLRGEASILDPESLPKKSYKQLARDMGLQVVNQENEHMVGLLELYEYLKGAPFVGPFGTIENPVLVPSVHTERIVGCTGGTGENEHYPLWFRCREGFLYRCGECDQIFMHVRVCYSLPDGKDPFPLDPDVSDVFSLSALEKAQKQWNGGEYVQWPAGEEAYTRLYLQGKLGNQIPEQIASTLKQIESRKGA